MDFEDTPEEAAFRAQARAWIAANAPHALAAQLEAARSQTTSSVHPPQLTGADPVLASKQWQALKARDGWACLAWPVAYGGRGVSPIMRVIWQQEEGAFAQLSNLFNVAQGMVGPTLIAHASDALKERYLKPIVSGAELWCQLFSEPSGGSDLAGLRSQARREGDDWILKGQKIWTTHGQIADFGLMVARHDATLPKHEGLTMFIVDMRSPGVTVRPIRAMTGDSHFNEVFLEDVRVPDSHRVGAVGGGWKAALTTLSNERLQLASAIATGVPEFVEFCRNMPLADGPAIDNPAVRARLATWLARANGLRWTMMRTMSALSAGKAPGAENSIGKLVAGGMAQDLCAFALDLMGPAGAVLQPGTPAMALQKMLLSSASIRVGGGTAEIQRNILAEQVLGMPPDARTDKGMPFNKIPTARS